MFWWTMAAAACLLVGTTLLPRSNRGKATNSCHLDEDMPKTDITVPFSRKVVLSAGMSGLQRE